MSVPAPVKEDHETQRKSGISFLAVFAVSLLVLLALLGLTEFLARIQQTEPTQPIRSVGNFQTQFETKWFKLHDYVKTNGGVDVILMGS